MKRFLPHLILVLIVGVAALSGQLSALVFQLADLSFRLFPRPASGDIVIVAIDRRSLDPLGPWPWPRRYHAAALDRLSAARARRIAFDIDFSGRTDAGDDQALADAIGRASGRVILPVFRQGPSTRAGQRNDGLVSPYAPFTLGARLASADMGLAADGRARRYRSAGGGNGGTIPGMASLLAGSRTTNEGTLFPDYGISPDTIPRLSFVDILDGAFRPEAIAGKSVIVGATAAELGDRLPVPVHGTLSGPLVHALAAESLLQGRNAYGSASLVVVFAAFLLCYSAASLWETWRRRAATLLPDA